jgi:Acetyltransferase (GNAT) domain
VRLRNVDQGDVGAYLRMRCDPVMMAELGGPLPREGIEEKVARDARAAAADEAWVKMIIPEEAGPEVVAGSVTLWSHGEDGGEPITEIGWMVLPEFQERGLAKEAVRMLLELAGDDGRWGSSMHSRQQRTARPTASAGLSASGWLVSVMSLSPAVFCGATTGSSTLPPTWPEPREHGNRGSVPPASRTTDHSIVRRNRRSGTAERRPSVADR